MSLGAIQSIAGADDGTEVSEDSFTRGLLAWGPATAMENEKGLEPQVRALDQTPERAEHKSIPRV